MLLDQPGDQMITRALQHLIMRTREPLWVELSETLGLCLRWMSRYDSAAPVETRPFSALRKPVTAHGADVSCPLAAYGGTVTVP